MKKTSIFLSLMTAGLMTVAQTARLSLYEEFTGENCPPCAAANPALQTLLNANLAKVVAIKWQVPIPSAPSFTGSLYQTDKIEIDWRYKSSGGPVGTPPSVSGYGYPSQWNFTTTATNGINAAPTGLLDGKHTWQWGGANDHAASLTAACINSAQAVMSPFSVVMNRAWNGTFSAVTVTVSITASQAFTSVGALVYRLVMVEQAVNFATPPGTNGEKDFYNAARACFPNVQSGYALPASWVVGQNVTFTINCTLPAYIIDKSQVNMIGFIQSDGNRLVHQAAKTVPVGLANDAAAGAITGLAFSCGTTYSPTITLKNNGTNTINSMTITPYVDGLAGANFNYATPLAPGATVAVVAPVVTTTGGAHTYSVNISGVSGGVDYNLANNGQTTNFVLVSSYFPLPITEPFTAITFPPTNWWMTNANGGAATWSRAAGTGGYAVGLGSAKYDFYGNNVLGDADHLYMTPANFTGVTNPMLTFDIAYCQYTNELDKLEVMVSSNCGTTWSTLYTKAGAVLAGTNPPQTAAFTAAAAGQWRTDAVNLNAYANMPGVLIKFVATSQYGNNLFIDNVNLSNTAGIKTNANNVTFVDVYPNPAQTETNVHVTLAQAGDVTITVMNSIGQTVNQKMLNLNTGDNNVTLDTRNLADGVYSVLVDTKNGSTVKKLTVSK